MKNEASSKREPTKSALVTAGLVSGLLISFGWAAATAPAEHKGLEVEELGFVPEA